MCKEIVWADRMREIHQERERLRGSFFDWVRFYRKNFSCSYGLCAWDEPEGCQAPDDCEELKRVWSLWLDSSLDENIFFEVES